MKKRADFVSNSSSSSFIVITDSGPWSRASTAEGEIEAVPRSEYGECDFGWQTEKYRDFWSKLNWCAIIAREKRAMEKNEQADETFKANVEKPWFRYSEMEALLKKVCADAGVSIEIDFSEDEYGGFKYGYIDHQSNIREEPDNARMFRDEKTLRDFLFNDGSYIDNSNDNGGRDDDEYDFDKRRYSSQPDDYYKAVAPEIETGAYDDILKEF